MHITVAFLQWCDLVLLMCRAREVYITVEQVQWFIDMADKNENDTIEESEFPDLIFAMAHTDLCGGMPSPNTDAA
jgi:hypothetical protein